LDEAIGIAKRLGAKKTWFTHCSHSMGLAAEVNRELPEGMMLAYDGLKIEI
jgi:phosphoribosyl 1,2-cyclic phosphate phosphodiesterase